MINWKESAYEVMMLMIGFALGFLYYHLGNYWNAVYFIVGCFWLLCISIGMYYRTKRLRRKKR